MKINFNDIEIKICYECPFSKRKCHDQYTSDTFACSLGAFGHHSDGYFGNAVYGSYNKAIHKKCPLKQIKKRFNEKEEVDPSPALIGQIKLDDFGVE